MARPRSVSDEEIVAAAVRAIGKHGPAHVTLAHVGAEAGVSAAALVQRFGSKAALLRAVSADGSRHAAAAFDRAESAHDSPLRTLQRALDSFAEGVSSRTELANHLGMLQMDLADEELRRQAAQQAKLVRSRIAGLLDAAVAAGELRSCDTTALATTVHTAYSGALITWAVEGRGSLSAWLRARLDAVLGPYRP
jgi:AcrR family transcriptional regulator